MLSPMGLIQVRLADGIERRLRRELVRRLGGKKGDLSRAVEEAVLLWLAKGARA
jgi:hypothetical protein